MRSTTDMVDVGKFPAVPSFDEFLAAANDPSMGDVEVGPTEAEITAFVDLVQAALDYWPSGMPTKYLNVMMWCVGENDGGDNVPVVILDDNRFEVCTSRDFMEDNWDRPYESAWDSDNLGPGSFIVAAWLPQQATHDKYANYLMGLGWEGDEGIWESNANDEVECSWFRFSPPADVMDRIKEAQGSSPFDEPHGIWLWAKREHPENYQGTGAPGLGELADYAVVTIIEAGLVRDPYSWAKRLIERSGAKLSGPSGRELRERSGDMPSLGKQATSALMDLWNKDAYIPGSAASPRDNPGCSYFVNDGTTEHGPFTLEAMCDNNAEHADLCEALHALEPGGELQVGGGADAAFVVRCEGEARSNPDDGNDMVVCSKHGWRHAPDQECEKCIEDREAPRANPSGQISVQSLSFDASRFTPSSAKKWAKARGFKATTKTDERDNTIRIRQDDPGAFARESFRTITLAEGVQAVIGLPRD